MHNYKVNINMPPLANLDELSESELSLFDLTNSDRGLFNLVDDELIKLSGSKLYFYKYYQTDDFDEVYLEARNKPISKEPVAVFGHYEPKVLEENLTQFGIELTNDQLFTFNKSYIDRKIGRSIIPGDVVQPHFQNQRYEIFQVQEDSFEAYGVYHLVCSARLLRDSQDTQTTPLNKITDNLGGNVYGE